ncbi:hypothetical protein B5M09_012779 [Aphanomyces astaci]|uniref:Uncharacterized protein n=1 Tax=Aphanomyces astaci TaxID=112090 RepID=A0A3R7Y0B9_APHAT|nr:hypothetical protein B5M09_012779 [Aphanomyces astaci]
MAAAVTRSMGRSATETKDDTAGGGRDPVVSSEGDGSHLSPEVVEVSIPAPDGPLNDNYSVPPDLLMTEQAKDTFVLATKVYLLEGAVSLDLDTLGYLIRMKDHFEGDADDDELLSQELLPACSFVDRALFPDGDLAYTNVESAVSKILNKRKRTDGEPKYLVLHADGNEYWTPCSRQVEYTSSITEYENSKRVNKGLPPLVRALPNSTRNLRRCSSSNQVCTPTDQLYMNCMYYVYKKKREKKGSPENKKTK